MASASSPDLEAAGATAFDPLLYTQLHQDLQGMSAAEARQHYERHGKAEGRVVVLPSVASSGRVAFWEGRERVAAAELLGRREPRRANADAAASPVEAHLVHYCYSTPELQERSRAIAHGQWRDLVQSGLAAALQSLTVVVGCDTEEHGRACRAFFARAMPEALARVAKIVAPDEGPGNRYEQPGLRRAWYLAHELLENEEEEEASERDPRPRRRVIIGYMHTKGLVYSRHGRAADALTRTPEEQTILRRVFCEPWRDVLRAFATDPEVTRAGSPSDFGFMWHDFWWADAAYLRDCCCEPVPDLHERSPAKRYVYEEWLSAGRMHAELFGAREPRGKCWSVLSRRKVEDLALDSEHHIELWLPDAVYARIQPQHIRAHVVYFVFLPREDLASDRRARAIAFAQLRQLEESGLAAAAASLHVVLASDADQSQRADAFLRDLKEAFPGDIARRARFYVHRENRYEFWPIRRVWEIAAGADDSFQQQQQQPRRDSPQDAVLYFHSKGMVFTRGDATTNTGRADDDGAELGRTPLERLLTNQLVGRWREILARFSADPTTDRVAFTFARESFVWFNFYWIRGSRLAESTPKPEYFGPQQSRYAWEGWVSGFRPDLHRCYSLAFARHGVSVGPKGAQKAVKAWLDAHSVSGLPSSPPNPELLETDPE